MLTRVTAGAKGKLAELAERVDERMARVDDRMDSMISGRSHNSSSSNDGRILAGSPATRPTAVVTKAPTPTAAGSAAPAASFDTAAAARAFEKVPKDEVVALLAKTNSRCRTLEGRYAELKALHSTLLEEKRQLIATRGREGGSRDEREQIEAELRVAYEDRLSELEEQVQSSGVIKKALQEDSMRLSADLAAAEAALKEATQGAEGARQELAQARSLLQKAEAGRDAAASEATEVRQTTAVEQASLLERLLAAQKEVGRLRASGADAASSSPACANGGEVGGSDLQHHAELTRVWEARVEAAEAASRAAQQAAKERVQALESQLADARLQAEDASAMAQKSAAALTESESGRTALKEELENKGRALSRALSNYKEEVVRWTTRLQSLEASRDDDAAKATARLEAVQAECTDRLLEAADKGSSQLEALRQVHESELAAAREAQEADAANWQEKIAALERRAAAEMSSAERSQADAAKVLESQLEAARLSARERQLAAEDEALGSRQAAQRAQAERDELASKLQAVQQELLRKSEHADAQQHRWQSHSASASEHEALVAKLQQQVDEMEDSYRAAKSVKASLEAELIAARRQLADAKETIAEAQRLRRQDALEAEQKEQKLTKELSEWRSKLKVADASIAELKLTVSSAERRLTDNKAAHSATLSQKEERIKELTLEVESGKPADQQMFSIARAQAMREEEISKLRAQLKSLRAMLKESHKVLTHLMQQEALLKEELRETQRKNARSDNLNVEYLKNVLVAFLVKVYGDADDDEHIKLAKVLQTILDLSPEENVRINSKIDSYCNSWWHRTANLLKVDPAGPTLWGSMFGSGAAEGSAAS